MRTFSEFQILGRVGKINEVGSTLRVSIAAEYGSKDNKGEFKTNPFWNEVTIFNENVIKWVKENTVKGDLVHARGTLRQTSWEKDGETEYGMTLAAEQFGNASHDERRRTANNQE